MEVTKWLKPSLGQTRTSRPLNPTSGFPPVTDIIRPARLVRLVPNSEVSHLANLGRCSLRNRRRLGLCQLALRRTTAY